MIASETLRTVGVLLNYLQSMQKRDKRVAESAQRVLDTLNEFNLSLSHWDTETDAEAEAETKAETDSKAETETETEADSKAGAAVDQTQKQTPRERYRQRARQRQDESRRQQRQQRERQEERSSAALVTLRAYSRVLSQLTDRGSMKEMGSTEVALSWAALRDLFVDAGSSGVPFCDNTDSLGAAFGDYVLCVTSSVPPLLSGYARVCASFSTVECPALFPYTDVPPGLFTGGSRVCVLSSLVGDSVRSSVPSYGSSSVPSSIPSYGPSYGSVSKSMSKSMSKSVPRTEYLSVYVRSGLLSSSASAVPSVSAMSDVSTVPTVPSVSAVPVFGRPLYSCLSCLFASVGVASSDSDSDSGLGLYVPSPAVVLPPPLTSGDIAIPSTGSLSTSFSDGAVRLGAVLRELIEESSLVGGD